MSMFASEYMQWAVVVMSIIAMFCGASLLAELFKPASSLPHPLLPAPRDN